MNIQFITSDEHYGHEANAATEPTEEETVVTLARELYDRFVMGCWEPQDAHGRIREILGMASVPSTSSAQDLKVIAMKIAAEFMAGENRCPVCGWTFALSAEQGCVLGNCSMREGTSAQIADRKYKRNQHSRLTEKVLKHLQSLAAPPSGDRATNGGKMMIQTLSEREAQLPIIAASWYDALIIRNPELSRVMSRQDYICAFCEWQSKPILCTSGGSTTELASASPSEPPQGEHKE